MGLSRFCFVFSTFVLSSLLFAGAERSPNEFKLLAENRRVLSDLAWPHVVLAHGRLYCKDRAGNLVCFKQ
jgi:hypothetical protein